MAGLAEEDTLPVRLQEVCERCDLLVDVDDQKVCILPYMEFGSDRQKDIDGARLTATFIIGEDRKIFAAIDAAVLYSPKIEYDRESFVGWCASPVPNRCPMMLEQTILGQKEEEDDVQSGSNWFPDERAG